MGIRTVLGDVNSKDLRIISPHEHVLIDIRNQYTEPKEATLKGLGEKKVSLPYLDILSRNPYALKDNLVLNNPDLAETELLEFKFAGGHALVDATPPDIGRDVHALYKISVLTGLSIIAGCGYYTFDTHPVDMAKRSVEQITDEITAELTGSIFGSEIRAGVIGEIGTSEVIHPNEEKVLRAAARAYKETNAGIIVHTYPWAENGIRIIDILMKEGVPPGKISINHVDVEINLDYIIKLVSRGVFVEFDNFGKEYYIDYWNRGFAGGVFARDIDRVKALQVLIEKGFTENILISCDICLKTLLHKFGGWGYDHVLSHIVPMMKQAKIDKDGIDLIVEENPKRFLEL